MKKVMNNTKVWMGMLWLSSLVLGSCEKMLTVKQPPDQLGSEIVFADSATTQAALNGMYGKLYNGDGMGGSIFSFRISTLPARSADELSAVQSGFDDFYNNSLVPTNADVADLWLYPYNAIYLANSIIEGVQASGTLPPVMRRQAVAEARFIRAFCHFYLVNYFGKVPLVLTTDLSRTATAPAAAADAVYAQIISDLTAARDSLGTDYNWSNGDRMRANKWVATAMLARVYLYRGAWAQAEAAASEVISQQALYRITTDLNKVFLTGSNEAIWQLYTNVAGYTYFASQMIPSGISVPDYMLSTYLYNGFEAGDQRRAAWTGSVAINGNTYTYPAKYKSLQFDNSESEVVMRLAEQYLIRAEARAKQDKLAEGRADIDVLRHRAGLGDVVAADKDALLLAIEQERKVELFCEWGHRWLDLKRTGRANTVLGTEKPAGWQATDTLYPIPQKARSSNTSLGQNEGYH